MSRVTHFEIQAFNPRRAIEFYESTFGWEFEQWKDWEYWTIETGHEDDPGINGGLIKRDGKIEGKGIVSFVCTIDVDDIDETLEDVVENGGWVAVPKRAVPEIGWLAYIKDTESNIIGVLEADPRAL